MEFSIFLILTLSHFFFDFAFQGKNIINKRFPLEEYTTKDKKASVKTTICGNLIHAFFHFIGSITLLKLSSLVTNEERFFSFFSVLIIVGIHFIIDEVKSVLVLWNLKLRDNIFIFLGDQFLHLISIVAVVYSLKFNVFITQAIEGLINGNVNFLEKGVIILILFVILTYTVGIFIKTYIAYLSYGDKGLVLDESPKGIVDMCGKSITKDVQGAKNGGFIIGVLERIFIVISIMINFPAMIGFILTGKSIARLKKLSNDSFAEYFIIGNFLSFIPAILIGLVINYIIKI
ncbi:MAG: DUF3307 domain-containing protein [Clostridium sp.]